jgi:transcription elongation factor Elf1
MEDEANLYLIRCPSCYKCPLCESVVVLSSKINEPTKLEMKCRYCDWYFSLVANDKTDFDVAIMENERQNLAIDLYKELLDMHGKGNIKLENRSLSNNNFIQGVF